MNETTQTLELPLFTRSVSLLDGQSENQTPTHSVGVLRPFSGLLGSDFERGGWGPLPLSHVVLSATVQQGLRPATDTGTTDRPADQEPSDQSPTTLRVRDLLRENSRESDWSRESESNFDRRDRPTTRTEFPSGSGEPRTGEPTGSPGVRTGGTSEIGLDESTDKLDKSTPEKDKKLLKDSIDVPKKSKSMSGMGESTSDGSDQSDPSDDRTTGGDSAAADSAEANSDSPRGGSEPPDLVRGDSERSPEIDFGWGSGDVTDRPFTTLDTPTTRRQSANETPTTARRIGSSSPFSTVEVPSSSPRDEDGTNLGSALETRPFPGQTDSPTGAFQMTYQRPEPVASSGTERTNDTEESGRMPAESGDSGRERPESPEPTGPPEIDLGEADVGRLVDRVYDEFQRKMRIERERRGL